MAVTSVQIFEDDVFEDGIYADFLSVTVDRLDILNKIIFIKTNITQFHPVDDLYTEVRAIRRIDESARVLDNPVSAQGNEPAGANFTPRRAVLNNGWRVGLENPVNSALQITGEIISEDGFAGAQLVELGYLPTGVSMLVNYTPPTSEVIQLSQATLETMVSEIWQRMGLDPAHPVINRTDGSYSVDLINTEASQDGSGNITQTRV